MDADAFEAAGLYDPEAADAADRLELLNWLVEQDLTLEELVDAAPKGRLTSIAGDRAMRPGARISANDLAEAFGIDVEPALQARRAAGLPGVGPDERVFTAADGDLYSAFEFARALFGDPAMLQFARVLGSSLARIAETAISMFLVNVEQPIKSEARGEAALARANLEAVQALETIPAAMTILFREHIEEAVRRFRTTRAGASYDSVRLAIGFVDLVGFTPLSQEIDASTLAQLIGDFEATAFDLVAGHDGRVVKLIGDEVMFATVSAGAACEIALGLAAAYSDESAVVPRGAVAVGDVLARAGDYFGPVVNLASRAAALAVPNEILVTRPVRDDADASDAALGFEPAGRRLLKGFDEPVELFTVSAT